MEKRTIGRFIATLRKANGMTQKELAEKLNVSDKTVSRWERDESAPDLTLIPVIAEIFDVTSDELLRGEKKPMDAVEESSEKMSNKSEKQLKHMINSLKTKLQVRSIISVGIAMVGIIVSIICNSVLYRAELAFLIGMIFIVIALICESIFYCLAMSSIRESELEDDLLWDCKMAFLKTMEKSIAFVVIVLAAMSPLLLANYSEYGIVSVECGITADAWVKYGFVAVLIAGVICLRVCYLINRRFLRENSQQLSDEELRLQENAHKRNKKIGLIIVLTLGITFFIRCFVNHVGDATWFMDGYTYDNYEDFVSFMEMESENVEYTDGDTMWSTISEDESETYKEELVAEDGTVLCSYMWNNLSVVRVDFGDMDAGYLPIKVYTNEHLNAYNQCTARINNGFLILYIVEIVGILLFFSNYKVKN